MNRSLLTILVIGACFLPLSSAFAGDRGHVTRDYRVESRDYRHGYNHDRRIETRRGYRAPATQLRGRHYAPRPQYRYAAPRYNPPHGYHARSWQRGHYLPRNYRASPYVLDHRSYRWAPPPRGYHYVRVDDRAVLVAITSGLIAEVLGDVFYR